MIRHGVHPSGKRVQLIWRSISRTDFEMTVGSHETDAPLVSVVMSVYNDSSHVGSALDALLMQTWQDFELIVVDDGSNDDTPLILERYQQVDSRIRVLRQGNLGLTLALIHGCSAARGKYIARHDSDDWSNPRRLFEQALFLNENDDIGLVACATQYVGPNDEPLEVVVRSDTPQEATRKLLDERQGPAAHGSVMFRRSLYEQVGGYRSEFYFGQDSDLWMRMCERSRIAFDAQLLYFARRDPLSLSGRMGTIQREFGRWGQECRAARREGRVEEPILAEARKYSDDLRSRKIKRTTSWGLATMAYLIGSTLARHGDPRARGYYWQAVCANPFYWRAWAQLFLCHCHRRSVPVERI